MNNTRLDKYRRTSWKNFMEDLFESNTGPGTIWANEINFVMNYLMGSVLGN